MRKFFYFRDTADEANDDDISKSVAIPVDAVTGIVPTAITSLIYKYFLIVLFFKVYNLVNIKEQ